MTEKDYNVDICFDMSDKSGDYGIKIQSNRDGLDMVEIVYYEYENNKLIEKSTINIDLDQIEDFIENINFVKNHILKQQK